MNDKYYFWSGNSPRDTLESHNGGWIDAGTDALEAFVQHCGVTYVDECRDNKQVLLIYKSWLRKQPVPERKHGNPECRRRRLCSSARCRPQRLVERVLELAMVLGSSLRLMPRGGRI